MKTLQEQQNGLITPIEDQNTVLNVFMNDDRDEEELEDAEAEERQDWGDVDPAGGEAPAAPGSAV